MSPSVLIAIPVFNEERHIRGVIPRVQEHADEILVVDDGSTDATPSVLAEFSTRAVRHGTNLGYGRALRSAFTYAAEHGFDWVITMDCDGQHEPERLPAFVDRIAAGGVDLISGTRYADERGDAAPTDRRAINRIITGEINERLGLNLTDAFCGFKAHRVAPMMSMRLTEDGYAFPLQLWVQYAAAGLSVEELPVPRIYNDPNRTFGGTLDDPETRLAHYREALHCELARSSRSLPAAALVGVESPCAAAVPCP